jgi:metal-responsive CopG/Arc/MetJ family transcriptional regulator
MYLLYRIYEDETPMKTSVNLTIDHELLTEIDTLRGREKRSTFIEHLVRLGLKTYKE